MGKKIRISEKNLVLIAAQERTRFIRKILKKDPAKAARLAKKYKRVFKKYPKIVSINDQLLQEAILLQIVTNKLAIDRAIRRARTIKRIANRFKEKRAGKRFRQVKSMSERFSKVIDLTPHLSVGIMDGNYVVAIVDGKSVATCRYALLTVAINEEIETADDLRKYRLPENKITELKKENNVTIEDELFAHASNLQGWVEHDYDPRMLDSHIAKPILEALLKVDEKAKNRFLAIIMERLHAGTEQIRKFIFFQYHGIIMKSDLKDDPIVEELKELIHDYKNENYFQCAKDNFNAVDYSRDADYIGFETITERDAFIEAHPGITEARGAAILVLENITSDGNYSSRVTYSLGIDIGINFYFVARADSDTCEYVNDIDEFAEKLIQHLGQNHPNRVIKALQEMMVDHEIQVLEVFHETIDRESAYIFIDFKEEEAGYDYKPEAIINTDDLKHIASFQGQQNETHEYVIKSGDHEGKYIEKTISYRQGSGDYDAHFIKADELSDKAKDKLSIEHE